MENMNVKEIEINGVKYVEKGSVQEMAKTNTDGMEYCTVRTYSAGVFAGYIDKSKIKDGHGTVVNARRLWYWAGAASLSQMATDGTSNPSKCKFPCEVDEVFLTNIIEVIQCTQKAKDSIAEVAVWKQ